MNFQPDARIDTRFVLLSTARSGTSAMISALKGHPRIFCHGEIYHQNAETQINPKFKKAHRLEDIDIKSEDFAYRVLSFTDGAPVVGFKMWRGQNPAACRKVAADEEIRKVVLERKNRLASYSSLKLAQKTDQWGKKDVARAAAMLSEFDEEDFTAYVARIDRLFLYYATECRGKVLFIEHREIGEGALQKVLEFLGVEPDATEIFMQRQHTQAVIERFAPEVRDRVRQALDRVGHPEWTQE